MSPATAYLLENALNGPKGQRQGQTARQVIIDITGSLPRCGADGAAKTRQMIVYWINHRDSALFVPRQTVETCVNYVNREQLTFVYCYIRSESGRKPAGSRKAPEKSIFLVENRGISL